MLGQLEDNARVLEQDKASTLHIHDDRVSCLRNKAWSTNKDGARTSLSAFVFALYMLNTPCPCRLLGSGISTTTESRSTPVHNRAMSSHCPNDKHKIAKANRLRPRLCNRRLARRHSLKPQTQTKFILRTKRSLADRNPELAVKLSQMRLTIQPIIHVLTGQPAPDFPNTMLSLFTLTEGQLDALAAFYSQSQPLSPSLDDGLKYAYPQTMDWSRPLLSADSRLPEDCRLSEMERFKVKMRMFARFIGMKGAETPGWEYERQVEILGRRIRRVVREEEKGWRGLGRD